MIKITLINERTLFVNWHHVRAIVEEAGSLRRWYVVFGDSDETMLMISKDEAMELERQMTELLDNESSTTVRTTSSATW